MPPTTSILAAAIPAGERDAMRRELRDAYASIRAGDLTDESVTELNAITSALEDLDAADATTVEDTVAALDARLDALPVSEPADAEPVAASAVKTEPVALSRLASKLPARATPRASVASGVTMVAPSGRELADVADIGAELRTTLANATTTKGDARFTVARVVSEPDHRLTGDSKADSALIASAVNERLEAITAAGGVCAPPTPYREARVWSNAMRPVRDGALVRAGTDSRGSIVFQNPIDITDVGVTGGSPLQAIDVITNSEDVSNATKPHQTFVCPGDTTVTVQAITNIIEAGNLLQRSSSEHLEQIIGAAAAAHARVAETQLLATINTASTQVTAGGGTVELGLYREFLRKVAHQASIQRSAFRMAPTARLHLIAPAWLIAAIQADIIGAAFSEGIVAPEVTQVDVERWLASLGVSVSWTQDGSGSQVYGPQQTGHMAAYPATVKWWLYPDGAWLFVDGGSLDLGIVRDSTLNASNQFQVFAETFENAALVGPWSVAVTQTYCPSGGASGTVDVEDLCTSGS